MPEILFEALNTKQLMTTNISFLSNFFNNPAWQRFNYLQTSAIFYTEIGLKMESSNL